MTTKSFKDVVRGVLIEDNSNSATLKPGSQHKDEFGVGKGNLPDAPEKIGDSPKKVDDEGIDATKPIKKDKSRSSQKQDGEPFGVGKDNIPPKAGKQVQDQSPENNDGEKFGVGKGNEPPAIQKNPFVGEDVELSEEELEIIEELLGSDLSEEEIIEELSAIDEEHGTSLVAGLAQIVSEEESDEDDDKKDDDDEDDSDEDEDDSDDSDDDKKDDEKNEEIEIDMTEDVNALVQGGDFTDEFKEKAKTVFETAVKAKIKEYQASLDEDFREAVAEAVDMISENLSDNVDDYLNYIVEQWVSENEVAIESSLKSELTEDFISGLRNLFAEHYIDIPEEKVNIIEELSEKVQELSDKLDEEIQTNVDLKSQINEAKKFEIIVDAVESLTDTQAEKIKALAEEVDFTNEAEFAEKIKTLKENYFPVKVKGDKTLTEADEGSAEDNLSPVMDKYVKVIGRSLPR